MSVEILKFSENNIFDEVYFYFKRFVGNDEEKFELAKASSTKAKEIADSKVNIISKVLSFNAKIAKGQFLYNGINFDIKNDISGDFKIYFYAINAGNFEVTVDSITDSFVDLYGTSYCNLGIDKIREYILKKENMKVSHPFGPGFYNIPVEKLNEYYKVLNPKDIGLTLSNNIMYPIKSCLGLFIVSEDEINLVPKNCNDCKGKSIGCSLCRNYNK